MPLTPGKQLWLYDVPDQNETNYVVLGIVLIVQPGVNYTGMV